MLLFSDSSSPWVHRRHCSGHSQEMSTRLSESIGENLVTEFAWPNVTGRLLERGNMIGHKLSYIWYISACTY